MLINWFLMNCCVSVEVAWTLSFPEKGNAAGGTLTNYSQVTATSRYVDIYTELTSEVRKTHNIRSILQ